MKAAEQVKLELGEKEKYQQLFLAVSPQLCFHVRKNLNGLDNAYHNTNRAVMEVHATLMESPGKVL